MTRRDPRPPRWLHAQDQRSAVITVVVFGALTALFVLDALDRAPGDRSWWRLVAALLGLAVVIRSAATWWWLHRHGDRRRTSDG